MRLKNEQMLDKFFAKSANRSALPDGQRIFAVGDIHGRLDLLTDLMARLEKEAQGGADNATSTIVFLGDYVDRGPDSRGVVDFLLRLADAPLSTVFLKGNHEAALLDFLHDPEDWVAWLEWGGIETMQSYGVRVGLADEPRDLAARFAAALPDDHLAFFKTLRHSHMAGDYFFAHAGVKPGAPLDAQLPEDLFWIRAAFHNCPADQRPDKTVVHGHHPTTKPVNLDWRIGVDTGAVWTGVLSAVALEGEDRRFITVKGAKGA